MFPFLDQISTGHVNIAVQFESVQTDLESAVTLSKTQITLGKEKKRKRKKKPFHIKVCSVFYVEQVPKSSSRKPAISIQIHFSNAEQVTELL